MTEAEWLTAVETWSMTGILLKRGDNKRKFQLWGCACCRRVWPLLVDERSRRGVEVAERFADGLASESERAVAFAEAKAVVFGEPAGDVPEQWGWQPAADAVWTTLGMFHLMVGPDGVAVNAADAPCRIAARRDAITNHLDFEPIEDPAAEAAAMAEMAVQADLLRDVFGNPFRPARFSADWRTDTAITLASQMYESREFSAMPILADALQDAGCDNDSILSHCRGEGPHVRGCWVIDLVLEKE